MEIYFNFEKYTLKLVITILSGTNLYFNRTLICGYYVKADLLRFNSNFAISLYVIVGNYETLRNRS